MILNLKIGLDLLKKPKKCIISFAKVKALRIKKCITIFLRLVGLYRVRILTNYDVQGAFETGIISIAKLSVIQAATLTAVNNRALRLKSFLYSCFEDILYI